MAGGSNTRASGGGGLPPGGGRTTGTQPGHGGRFRLRGAQFLARQVAHARARRCACPGRCCFPAAAFVIAPTAYPPATEEVEIDREARVNERILVPEVRLIGPEGEQIGITPLAEALRLAREQEMDLVEVAAQARPPVARIMDYGKFKYQQDVKAKEARKRQSHIVIKEMKMRPKIDSHDYITKSRHVERFLREGSKVKATIMFRGREMAHQELGQRLLDRLAADMNSLAFVESAPNTEGRNMSMVLAPFKDGPREAPTQTT